LRFELDKIARARENIKAQGIDEAKGRFFANISHECASTDFLLAPLETWFIASCGSANKSCSHHAFNGMRLLS